MTGLTAALDERYSKEKDYENDIFSDMSQKIHEGTLLEDDFVSDHLTDDYDFRDNLLYSYSVPNYIKNIAYTAMKSAVDTGATVWNTTFETAKSLSNSPFGKDVSTLASKVYHKYKKSYH